EFRGSKPANFRSFGSGAFRFADTSGHEQKLKSSAALSANIRRSATNSGSRNNSSLPNRRVAASRFPLEQCVQITLLSNELMFVDLFDSTFAMPRPQSVSNILLA